MKSKVLLITLVSVLVASLGLMVLIWSVVPRQYITTDVADYGKYTGNYDNKSVQAFITSFFPEAIESTFSDVTYSYRAQKNDTYAFEAYLEFTIQDVSEYESFVKNSTLGLAEKNFYYDDSYTEYVIADEFDLNSYSGENNDHPESLDTHIRYARIGKILCSKENQKIIYVALGVYDGGIVTTDFLSAYFDRFHINPREYIAHSTGDGSVVPCMLR